MASLSGEFNFQAFADAGTPLASGRLYTYVAGTTTNKTAYTDAAGSVAHSYTSDGSGGSYIALNSRGELPAPLFLASGAYDITLKTSAGVTVWTRRATPMETPTISVANYGADSTGVSDSTDAFNAATAALRLATVDTPDYDYAGAQILVPPGVYSVSSWDLTNLLIHNVSIVGYGAVIVARTAGKAVVDCLGSRYIKFYGLFVYSASATQARCGFQLGNKGTEACGNQSFDGVTAAGYYSLAPLLNQGSETTSYRHTRFIQRSSDTATYAAVFDSLGTYLPQSDYATVTKTSGTAVSFTANSAQACQFRHEGGGSAAYLSGAKGWTFDLGTYWLAFNKSCLEIYSTSSYRCSALDIRGSFETNQDNTPAGATGMNYAVTFSNNGTNTAIDGFTFQSSNMHADTALFRVTGGGSYRISGADIKITALSEAVGAVMFGAGSLSIDGKITSPDATKTNLGTLTAFNGEVFVDTYGSLASVPAAGSYTIHSRTDNTTYHGGTCDFTSFTFTPATTFATPGDLSVSYSAQSGWGYKIGKMRFIQIALTFTPTYTTASGEFRISGIPAASAAGTNQESAFGVANLNSGWTWPASTTQVTGRLPANSTNMRLYGHLTGGASTVFSTTHVPSGTAKSLILSGWYLEP